ncbi:tRNA 2-thiouridine(34) synthase MnmA [Pseudodesulfovibrio sp. F-1]|uniref:tRNA-specific 2-thiouridylase MnmA n=1 Tax=Pseudodesulfovibrio alkaliphilus TaxID=2661613 RepID=A0A7K1KJJ5_9BACT|nr:tRNA 2-thiouridine(34) synthase MnmA [Pseudodesulfovibrio alkaliphilus]MUM76244.1 tRNA 2-thiouridine(34) synthase MnmA [Pseudodesulfovibrio alkaliphilus]
MTTAVAVSGGMDSLLALALMKERGHDVLALHGRFLPGGGGKDAAAGLNAACARLDVPFHVVDLRPQFEREVVAPFADAYRRGLTPNPCAVCNPRMKFGALFDAARALGAESLATGHYAQLVVTRDGPLLARGADPAKDQSYFLSLVGVGALRRACFPLGALFKRDVPARLAGFGLTPSLPGESQEICFVPGDDYQAFLARRGSMPGGGPILLEDDSVIGRHRGLWRHTQGQRRGLGIAWTEPLYVLHKRLADNALIVGPKTSLLVSGCVAGRVNLMTDPAGWPEEVMVQTRYRQRPRPARFAFRGDHLVIRFREPHERPAPGQVAAVYDQQGAVLGGGVIERSLERDGE